MVTDLGNPEARKLRGYPAFDWLRFVLASAVVFYHGGLITWARAGNLAVVVFFALSGWLIGGILLRTSARELPRFYFNRGTRIWIPYLLTVAALYGIQAVGRGIDAEWWRFLFYDLTFTHNWFTLYPDVPAALARMPLKGTGNHFWSISVEEQFYLVAPVFVLFTRFGRKPATWLAFGLVMAALGWNAAGVGFGVGAACLQQERPDWHRRPLAYAALAIVAAGCAAGMALVPEATYGLAAPVFAICLVLLCAVPGPRSTVGEVLGGLSYPLYLLHWLPGIAWALLLRRLAIQPPALLGELMGYGVGVGAVAVFWYAVDRNVQRYRSGWFTQRRGRALALSAYMLAGTGLVGGTALLVARWGVGAIPGLLR